MISHPDTHLHGVDVVTLGGDDNVADTVIALAHGAGGGIEANFAPLVAHLPYRLTGPNYPGSGATPPATDPLDVDVLADQVVAAGLRAGHERFPVLGLSLGAAVAVTAAVRHPEHVSALILTVGLARSDAQSRAFTAAWRALDAAGDLDSLARLMLLTVGTGDVLDALGDGDADVLAEFVRTYPRGSAAQAELAERVDVTGLLAGVDVPTLAVVAGADRIVLPSTARRFGAIPGARVVEYPTAGHIFGPGEVAAWAADVRAFVGEAAALRTTSC